MELQHQIKRTLSTPESIAVIESVQKCGRLRAPAALLQVADKAVISATLAVIEPSEVNHALDH